MVYTVEETVEGGRILTQTYEGFCKAFIHESVPHELKLPPADAKFLGLIMWEDSISPWWLENNGLAVEELQRLHRTMPGIDAKINLIPVDSIIRSF